ncbi:MAG: hypothetical protein N2A42_07425, partial [Luteolibacter sp.]
YLYIWNGWADGETQFRNESMSGLTYKAMKAAAKTDTAIAARVKLYDHRVREELYDVRIDPFCLNNLITKPNDKFSPRTSAMTKALWHQMKDTDDPQLKRFQSQVELALD